MTMFESWDGNGQLPSAHLDFGGGKKDRGTFCFGEG